MDTTGPDRGPHPSWSDPARDPGAPCCSHGYGWAERCPRCRRSADDRVDSRGETQGDGRGCALVVLVFLAVLVAIVLALVGLDRWA